MILILKTPLGSATKCHKTNLYLMIGRNDWSHILNDCVSEHFTYTWNTLNIQHHQSTGIPAALKRHRLYAAKTLFMCLNICAPHEY